MRTVALVDYDNMRLVQTEKTSYDAAANLEQLRDEIRNLVSQRIPQADELELRLYGGWTDEDGYYSQVAQWLLANFSNVRDRGDGLRIHAVLATAAMCRPSEQLRGLVRSRTRNLRQKMVDELLTVDAVHLARARESCVLIASDDDDMVPAILAASLDSQWPVHLLREHTLGCRPNDDLLKTCGTTVHARRADSTRGDTHV